MSSGGRFDGERAVVVGFGTSGRAAAEVLAGEGAEVLVTDARPRGELGDPIPGIPLMAGGNAPEHLDGATLVVTSPGVPPSAPVLRWAAERGLPVWDELELGALLCRVSYVAVTGTNGKTTTVELLAHMMRAAGLRATACGNIGYPFSLAARGDADALAVEASSFQLARQRSLHPKVSVLLNLAPDHLDWHGSHEAYADAKARIYARQGAGDVHVGNASDAASARVSRDAPCQVRWFREGAPQNGEIGLEAGAVIVLPPGPGVAPGSASASFAFQSEAAGFGPDAAAAVTAALAFGLAPDAVRAGLASFAPLPHRGETVAEVGMVRFLDDSKATNPHATLAALEGRRGAVLIAGGLAKGVDLSPLRSAAGHLAAVIAIGEAAPQIEAAFDGLVPVRRAGSMAEAVAAAFEEARPGGEVLLAPACASQDMFRDYRERGDRFAEAARALALPADDDAVRPKAAGGKPRAAASPSRRGGTPDA
jgi:UDP-N-acetylmuramoylalanine--D-glutamate ligase